MRRTDVLIISTQSFPYGEAATNRIISYAKVLAEDFKVRYVSITPDFLRNPANLPNGVFNDIDYEYATGDNTWNPEWPKWKKGLRLLKGRINIPGILREAKPETVILVTRDKIITKWFIYLSKIFKFRLIIELTELTNIKNAKNNEDTLALYSKVYGILCISREIVDHFSPIRDHVKLFHLPMSVDVGRFSQSGKSDRDDRYFAMCSGNNWERDGAMDSIKAFLSFSETHRDYKLKIAGMLNDKTNYSREFKTIVESNRDNRVEYLGRLSSDMIPQLIQGATATLMTPHKDYESGGFPTKLGEYLASGIPVICTSVSEIPDYLDESNSFICPPNDISAIVKCMNRIVDDPEEAEEIGKRGRNVATTVFNVTAYKLQLIDFVLGK